MNVVKGGYKITQKFSTGHKAIDIVPTSDKGVYAPCDGKVVMVQTGQKNNPGSKGNASYGNFVKLDHGSGVTTLFAHLASVAVKNGATVKKGQKLGVYGNTGNSYGAHLHYEVRVNNTHQTPERYPNGDFFPDAAPTVTYKAYAGIRWYPEVTGCNDTNANGYAGVINKPLTALMAKSSRGTLQYRVHLLKENRWLPWVVNYNDYAGNKGKQIDCVQAQLLGVPGYEVEYRVSPVNNKGWYGWVRGTTTDPISGDAYAGVWGKAIDTIQMRIVKK